MWIRNKNKTARFSVPAPGDFVAENRAFLPFSAPAARDTSALSAQEVQFGGEILTFARTYFEQNN